MRACVQVTTCDTVSYHANNAIQCRVLCCNSHVCASVRACVHTYVRVYVRTYAGMHACCIIRVITYEWAYGYDIWLCGRMGVYMVRVDVWTGTWMC